MPVPRMANSFLVLLVLLLAASGATPSFAASATKQPPPKLKMTARPPRPQPVRRPPAYPPSPPPSPPRQPSPPPPPPSPLPPNPIHRPPPSTSIPPSIGEVSCALAVEGFGQSSAGAQASLACTGARVRVRVGPALAPFVASFTGKSLRDGGAGRSNKSPQLFTGGERD